jgi:hypothetical protein
MTHLAILPWREYFTIGAAALGAVLGIMNTWNSISQRRVRLRIRPAHAIGAPDGRHMFAIEVINLSTFAVTISDVGLCTRRGIKGPRHAVGLPLIIDGKPWPRRLEPREAVSAYFDHYSISDRQGIRKAYARTSCEEVAYGSSPALRQITGA